jgi:hypothetical protein
MSIFFSVDFALAGQCEPPFSHGRGRVVSREGDQPGREPSGSSKVARGAKLEEVEAVVSAAEALFEEACAEIRLEASQDDRLAGGERGDYLSPLAGRELDPPQPRRSCKEASVAGN